MSSSLPINGNTGNLPLAPRSMSTQKKRVRRIDKSIPSFSLGGAMLLFSIFLCLYLLKREVEFLSDISSPNVQSSRHFLDDESGDEAGRSRTDFDSPKLSALNRDLSIDGGIQLHINTDRKFGISADLYPENAEKQQTDTDSSSVDNSELDQSLRKDVTIVICGKHSMSNAEKHLEAVLASTPPMPILYIIAGNVSVDEATLAYLTRKKRLWPHLELHDAGPLAPGYQCRNISAAMVGTKYALYLFNDVYPASRNWLQALYTFAEKHPEGVAFSPFVWENSTTGPWAESHPHTRYVKELNLDDFANDGKLYLEHVEEVDGMGDDWLGTSVKTRETPASLEDHCLLARMAFVRESGLWDPQAGFTRQDIDLALTVRYWKGRSYIVGDSQVVFVHPGAHLKPWDLPMFAAQSSEETCGMNVVHLRHKWGLITGQRCRAFTDTALRPFRWSSESLPAQPGKQTQLLVAIFSLLGMNRFRITGLASWLQPRKLPPLKCQSRGGYNCPQEVPWMTQATDTSTMLAALDALDASLADVDSSAGAGVPELWLGRNEVLLPVRLNRLLDSDRGHALLNGQLFPVRKGNVRRGDKHAGRKAPDLVPLSRLYLPFMVVEAELALPLRKTHKWQGASTAPDAAWEWDAELSGFSVVTREGCRTVAAADASKNATRRCAEDKMYLRAFMFVRYLDAEDGSPSQALGELREVVRSAGGSRRASAWVQGSSLARVLVAPLDALVQRIRMVLCAPGTSEPCSMAVPLGGPSSQGRKLLMVSWKPQTVKTARVQLFGTS